MNPEAERYRALARGNLRRFGGLVYRHTATWSGEASPCRFSVVDPSPATIGQVRAQAASSGLPFEDLRLLHVHPDDPRPSVQATIPWEDGLLEVLAWGQTSDFTGTAVGTAVMRR